MPESALGGVTSQTVTRTQPCAVRPSRSRTIGIGRGGIAGRGAGSISLRASSLGVFTGSPLPPLPSAPLFLDKASSQASTPRRGRPPAPIYRQRARLSRSLAWCARAQGCLGVEMPGTLSACVSTWFMLLVIWWISLHSF